MSNNKLKAAARSIAALALAGSFVCAPAPASATETPSSPADRQRLVSLAHKLEQTPLDPALKDDRAWAIEWLTNVPDIAVEICSEPLGGLVQSKYRYAPEIVVQDMFSMAAFQIEHPKSATDLAAQQLAGVQGALKVYRAILKDKPNARSPALDTLLQTEAMGGLPDFARKAWLACAAHKAKK
ncbi:MAG TPA: hypothetical protein VGC56_12840 [Allosphingosinicella sp.]|jgi:hypothetical protein